MLGRYDIAMMVEAEDNEAVARLSLDIGVRAGLHIETLPVTSIGIPGKIRGLVRVVRSNAREANPRLPTNGKFPAVNSEKLTTCPNHSIK